MNDQKFYYRSPDGSISCWFDLGRLQPFPVMASTTFTTVNEGGFNVHRAHFMNSPRSTSLRPRRPLRDFNAEVDKLLSEIDDEDENETETP